MSEEPAQTAAAAEALGPTLQDPMALRAVEGGEVEIGGQR
jgi:hypothetical protein